MRRVFNAGGFAAVARRGMGEAGAIFVVARGRDGTCRLFGPAAQTSYEEDRPAERLFTLLAEYAADETLAARLEKEARFDPDFWVVEVEVDEALLGDLMTITTP
jgi:hypothetical protein